MTSFDGKAITYDEIGNPLTYDGWTCSWDAGRQLASMAKDGTELSFRYNDSGITEKTVNGRTVRYTLQGDQVVHETDGENSIHYRYDGSGSRKNLER